jgi:phosphatidate cytidylyltransferase
VWRDDLTDDATGDTTGGQHRDMTGEVPADSLSEPLSRPPSGEIPTEPPPRREPGRITIGTDPSGVPRRPPQGSRRRGSSGQTRSGRPAGPARTTAGKTPPPRNLPAAIGAGLVLAALFVILILWRPVGVIALVTVVLAIAGFEYFGKVTEKGYRPAVAPGLAACVAAPLVAYWIGDGGLPLVVAFAFIAGAIGFIGAAGVESGPLPNMAVTTMGVVWVGLLGSYAALITRWSNTVGGHAGTDTLFVVVLGVVANDIGALVVGSSLGKTPLRSWISPGKTVEGLIGGTVLTLLVLFIVGLTGRNDTWSTGHLLLLGLLIAIFAPLGDLTESMFKRNLDVKDFGALLSGHGGVLDRFDAFLFVLPIAYYFTLVLQPWT